MSRSTVSNRSVLLADVVELRPAHFVRPCALKPLWHVEIIKQQLLVFDAKMVKRKHIREISPTDLVPPLYQCSYHVFPGFWIREPGRLNDCTDIVIGERHDLLRRPVLIVRKATHESRVWKIGFPLLRVEGLGFK